MKALLILLLPLQLFASSTIAVLSFDSKSVPEYGEQVQSYVANKLIESGYKVVERARIQKVIDEQKFSLKNSADKEVIKIGRLIPADLVITGSFYISKNGVECSTNRACFTVLYKVLDTETGELVYTKTFKIQKFRSPPFSIINDSPRYAHNAMSDAANVINTHMNYIFKKKKFKEKKKSKLLAVSLSLLAPFAGQAYVTNGDTFGFFLLGDAFIGFSAFSEVITFTDNVGDTEIRKAKKRFISWIILLTAFRIYTAMDMYSDVKEYNNRYSISVDKDFVALNMRF
jgi:hypothetical protein